jgi:hypothetical protein
MKQLLIATTLLLGTTLLVAQPAAAQSEITVTAAAGGIYPPGTSFNGVPLNGLRFSIGVTISTAGSAEGQFRTTLVGVSALGLSRSIEVDGIVSAGSSTAANTVTFSGRCTLDLGDGTLPLENVPFTVVLATNADSKGNLTTNLPAAKVDDGSVSIK